MAHTKDDIIRFAASDFHEMPGLRLTEAQARRLWSLDRAVCQDVLDTLVEQGFLTRMSDGRYRRSADDLEQRLSAGRMRPHAGAHPRIAAA